eukprot:scaffold10818_cov133-Isochrysis_galbana.AAC.1
MARVPPPAPSSKRRSTSISSTWPPRRSAAWMRWRRTSGRRRSRRGWLRSDTPSRASKYKQVRRRERAREGGPGIGSGGAGRGWWGNPRSALLAAGSPGGLEDALVGARLNPKLTRKGLDLLSRGGWRL